VTPREEWVFISYETSTGLNLARLTKMRLRLAGYKGWVWHDDSKIGEYTLEEIADNVKEFQHFVYICTWRSHRSEGQRRERGWALALGKDPIVIAFDGKHVSPVLSHCKTISTTNVDFQRACDAAASEIARRRQVKIPAVVDEPAADHLRLPATISEAEGDSIEPS
jgi:hypothetical protein